MNTTTQPVCRVCRARLEADGVCLACLLTEAISAVDVDVALSAELEAARAYSSIGRLELPCMLAGYKLLREIASGGMGIVYEAEDVRLKRHVALKMLRSAAFARPEELARFRVEAELAAQLDHPYIVPIYEVGDVDGMPFFTMRLIEGSSLGAKLAEAHTAMPAREAAALIAKVARAVQHAHERGVLHRDLKPANILLDDAGEPHLTDFGLAKLLDEDNHLTRSTAHLGTPHYMSPEQAAGRTREVTTASDVWALGVLLYQLLTRRLPYTGQSSAEIMQRIIQAGPVPITGMDADLATLIARCLEKEPERRLTSAGFLADELCRWLQREPIQSRPVDLGEHAWKWMRRHRAATFAITGILSAIFIGSGLALWQWRQAAQARDAAQKQLRAAESASQTIMEILGRLEPEHRGPAVAQEALKKAMISQLDAFDGDPARKMEMLFKIGETLDARDAIEPYEKALEAGQRALDPNDPRLWSLRLVLATAKADVAGGGGPGLIPEFRRIHEWSVQHRGALHDDTMLSQFELGRRLGITGQYEEGLKRLEEVDRYLATHPESQIPRSQARSDYAMTLFDAGRRDEGLAMGREMCEELTQHSQSDVFFTARMLHNHARLCRQAGLTEEGLTIARRALDLFYRSVGPADNYSHHCFRLVQFLLSQQRDSEGRVAGHRARVHEFDMQMGPGRKETLGAVADCARMLEIARRSDEAQALCVQWLDRVRNTDGTLPAVGTQLLSSYIRVLIRAGKSAEAATATQELNLHLQRQPATDWKIAIDHTDLGEVLILQNKQPEALKPLQTAIMLLEANVTMDNSIQARRLPKARKLLEQAKAGEQQKP